MKRMFVLNTFYFWLCLTVELIQTQWYMSASEYETGLSLWRPCPFHSHEYADRLALSPGH